jgi:ABC-type Fe3+/spermidine/putrescine transport system ATPase subunit
VVETPLGEIRCRSALTLAAGDAALVMVRPESVRLSREPPDNPDLNGITGRVRDRFYLGNIAGYRVLCGDGSVLQVQEEPWHAGAVGDTVWCLFTSELAWIIRR